MNGTAEAVEWGAMLECHLQSAHLRKTAWAIKILSPNIAGHAVTLLVLNDAEALIDHQNRVLVRHSQEHVHRVEVLLPREAHLRSNGLHKIGTHHLFRVTTVNVFGVQLWEIALDQSFGEETPDWITVVHINIQP